ncbi:bifunctional acetate--CoA ligase family protein/GNAT family N-acetyltransferase, partial [Dietzia sp.]|uniref:bifunctional acetate--CoA ligase family protein/GNAT family N-acetyltransferase n=1 Tax=Dietzia sp. TaxID=1871616 RepID=UPI002FD88F77
MAGNDGESEFPAGYRADWAADVLGSDGRAVRIRPVLPSDAEELQRFHSTLSDRTRYLRYFGSHNELSKSELDRMTHVDYSSRMAFVALLGDEIIGTAVYEGSPGSPIAEVAFTLSDSHQGRGLGSIFLEHLAGAAAEKGIRRFEAEVLSENRQMIQVFRRAGYDVSRSFDGSSIHLEFDIDPSDALTSVRNAREAAAEARSVARVLSPASIAVIGASEQPSKLGYAVLRNLLEAGFAGPVYPVNSEARSVQSIRAYPSLGDIPDPVDLAVVAVPAESMDTVLADCLHKGVSTLVVISAGFSDVGGEGIVSERRLVAQARAHGMRVVGPNALGVINNASDVRLNATLASSVPAAGRIGFFCQSGALGIAILDSATRRGLGLATFVSAGNRADLSGNDLLQFWDTEVDTEVVLLYLESFGNPRKFSRIARRVARNKPVVVVHRSSDVAAGEFLDVTAQAAAELYNDLGLIPVTSLPEMFDVAALLAYQPLPAGPRIAIVANSTAVSTLAADAAEGEQLEVVSFVDLGAAASPEAFSAAVESACEDSGVDAVLAVFVPPVERNVEAYAEAIRLGASEAGKPVASTFLAVEGLPEALTLRDESGEPVRGSIPSYAYPERAISALRRALTYRRWLDRPAEEPMEVEGIDLERARQLVDSIWARHAGGGNVRLSAGQTRQLMRCFGIPIVDYRVVASAADAEAAASELGYPVAVKAMSEAWRRRSDLSGVRLDVGDGPSVRRAFEELSASAGEDAPIHVQRMAPRGTGITLKVGDHPIFGSLISFGLSGMITEMLGDRAYSALPLTREQAENLLERPAAAPILGGNESEAAADKEAIR